MSDSQLQKVLILDKISADYFASKRVAIDFGDLAARTAEYTAYDLLMKHDIRPLLNYFRQLVEGLITLNSEVYLIIDGEPLVLKAHSALPEAAKRRNSLQQSKWLFKGGNKRESQSCLAEAFEVSKGQVRELVGALSEYFKGKPFTAICAPHECFSYINYMARSKMVDCVISNAPICVLTCVDVIQNFRLAHDYSYLGEIAFYHNMCSVFETYGGFASFLDVYTLSGNQYFPGFWKTFSQVKEVYDANYRNVVKTACVLNEQHLDQFYKMTDDYLFKGIFYFYCHFYHGIVYKFDSKTFGHANALDPTDAQILDRFFEKKSLGFVVYKAEIVIPYVCGFDKTYKGAKLEDNANFQRLSVISGAGVSYCPSSILQLLGASLQGERAVMGDRQFDLRVISFQGSYLENKTPTEYKAFRYARAQEVDFSIEGPVFAVKEEREKAGEVVIKF